MKLTITPILSKTIIKILLMGGALVFGVQAQATTVQFQTSLGDFEVNLYDEDVPATVANFLAYVDADIYTDIMVNRAIPGFVVQAGGFTFTDEDLTTPLATFDAVINEPVFSNVEGTIAMAKVGGQPNSATNEWYFNLSNNSQGLDVDNGGYTVFGEVTGNGMAIVQAMAALDIARFDNGAFSDVPSRDYESGSFTTDNFVFINIVVLDAAADTAAGLNPERNVLINAPAPTPAPSASSGGGGGSFGFGVLFVLLGAFVRKRLLRK